MNKFMERDGVDYREWRLRGHRLRNGGHVPAVFLGSTFWRWWRACPACRSATIAFAGDAGAHMRVTCGIVAGAGIDAAGTATLFAWVLTTSATNRWQGRGRRACGCRRGSSRDVVVVRVFNERDRFVVVAVAAGAVVAVGNTVGGQGRQNTGVAWPCVWELNRRHR